MRTLTLRQRSCLKLALIISYVDHYYMGQFYMRTLTLHKIIPYIETIVNTYTGITLHVT